LNGPLKEKSLKIEELMIQIDELLNQNKAKAKEMLHGISLEYESVVENITKIDGNKKAELSFNSSELQKDIINIQKILEILNKKNINYFNVENGGITFPLEEDENDKIVNFLLQYKSLVNDIDQIISKPTNKILTKEDEEKILKWPIELNDSKEKLSNYLKLKKLLKIKDDIIWKLLITPYEEKCPELYEVEKKTKEEISKWTQLIEKTKSELSKYNIVCHFCGCPLEHGMNTLCPLNDSQHPYENKNLTNDNPPQNLIGNNKHYFTDPSEMYQKQIDAGEYFDVNLYLKRRDFQQYNTNFLSSMSAYREANKRKDKNISDLMRPSISSEWVNKSARIIEENNINLFQILSEYDIKGSGFIGIRDLIMALTKIKIILTEEDKDSLRKYLRMSGYDDDKINIKAFSQHFGKTSTYDDLYSDSNNKKNNPPSQMCSNGFNNNTINYNNCSNDNYFKSSMQRNLTFPQNNQMVNNSQGFLYGTGFKGQ
jgi:hypothetical protein